jgi:hypothetical protein
MGLSIHYSFNAGRCSAVEILSILKTLRGQTQRLSFHEVDTRITHLIGEDCQLSIGMSLSTFLPLASSRFDPITSKIQAAEQIIGFMALPRPGAEALPIFLAQYPASQEWIASGHCKTIFASLPKYGGLANFVLAHTMVIEILAQAQQLEILESVVDESGYWEERNFLCLADKSELLTLSDEVIKQAESVPPDFVSSLVGQIQSAVK